MDQRFLVPMRWLSLAVLLLAANPVFGTAASARPATADRVRDAGVPADTTLTDSVAAGSVLIRMLPGSLGGEPVTEYRAITIPSRGWLYQHSFFWRVPSDARDRYTFLFEAIRPSVADTVRLQVAVTDPEW